MIPTFRRYPRPSVADRRPMRKGNIIMIMDNKSTASLDHRIDALRTALRTLGTDPNADTSVRRMAAALRASAGQEGSPAIADLARAVEDSSSGALEEALQNLIAGLRAELASHHQKFFSILIVSADTPLVGALIGALASAGHKVITCESTQSARQILREANPAILVVDSVLPAEDGRILIRDLRSSPGTAAMPILAIVPRNSVEEKSASLVNEADAYFRKPVDAAEFTQFLSDRFRRGHDQGRFSRRDPLTGLLNRAAFTETMESLQASSRSQGSPLSLALLTLPDADRIDRTCTNEARDELLRKIASILSVSLRSTDVVARWGLHEFAVAFPGEDHFGMSCALEKVLAKINRLSIATPNGQLLPIHACAGCTVVAPNEPAGECIARAEGFLFQARFTPPNDTVLTLVSDSLPREERTARVALFVGDATMEKAIAQMIERDRIEVEPLHDHGHAVEQLAQGGFHMLIVDDSVLGNAAFSLIQTVRKTPQLNRLYIVLLAANEESVTRGLDLGASDYILKPVAAPSFADRIRRHLSRRIADGQNRPFTVMIVDTDVPQLLIAGTVLYRQSACNVILARGFHDAITRFRESPPDCLIVDFGIPLVALSDFLDRLSRLPGFATVRIVAGCARPDLPAGLPCGPGQIAGRIEHPYKPASFLHQLGAMITIPKEPQQRDSARIPIESEIQRLLARSR